jgi:hypothetical protein
MSESETAPAAAVARPVPAHEAVVERWFRDTFHGSAIGRELSNESHNRLFDAVADLKARLAAA